MRNLINERLLPGQHLEVPNGDGLFDIEIVEHVTDTGVITRKIPETLNFSRYERIGCSRQVYTHKQLDDLLHERKYGKQREWTHQKGHCWFTYSATFLNFN